MALSFKNLKSNVQALIRGQEADEGSFAGTVQRGAKKIKEHFKKAPIGKILTGAPPKDILLSLKDSVTGALKFPTQQDFKKLEDSNTTPEEKERLKEKAIN